MENKIKIITLITIINIFFTFSVAAEESDEIYNQIIKQSISSYKGECPCPYSKDSSGNVCGGRSAYARKGGLKPICYKSDITDEMIDAYQEEIKEGD